MVYSNFVISYFLLFLFFLAPYLYPSFDCPFSFWNGNHPKTLQQVLDCHLHQESDVSFEDLKVVSNDQEKMKKFLNKESVNFILADYTVSSKVYGNLIPVMIDPNSITLDYRLTAKCLNDLINNPRKIKKHFEALSMIAHELESLEG